MSAAPGPGPRPGARHRQGTETGFGTGPRPEAEFADRVVAPGEHRRLRPDGEAAVEAAAICPFAGGGSANSNDSKPSPSLGPYVRFWSASARPPQPLREWMRHR